MTPFPLQRSRHNPCQTAREERFFLLRGKFYTAFYDVNRGTSQISALPLGVGTGCGTLSISGPVIDGSFVTSNAPKPARCWPNARGRGSREKSASRDRPR